MAAALNPQAAAGAHGEVPAGSFADQLWSALRPGGQSPRPPARGLPIAQLISPTENGSTHYAMTTIDVWGRLSDRSSLRVLQWRPGLPLAMSVVHGAVVVVASQHDGPPAITRQGHLRLPASVRHRCRLDGGHRILLVACPDRGLLVAYTMSALDAMVLAYHATLVGEAPQ